MADYKKIENYISNIATIWHNAGMEASNYVGCMLYVMGLKKMVEENACMNPEYMSSIVALTKVLYHPTSPSDIDIIRNASRVLEETYHAKEGLFTDVLSTYRSEEESWKKAFLDIVAATAQIEIDEDGYAPYVQQILYYASKDGRDKAEKISSNAVADLLSIGADIKDGDTVLDGAIGYGYSAMKCIHGKKDIKLYGVDLNTDALQVSSLYMILCGVDCEMMQEDCTAMGMGGFANKVVMDIPFGMRPRAELAGYQLHRANKWMDSDTCKEMEALFIAAGIDYMEDGGRLVVIVPQRFMFGQSKALSNFRKNLIKEGLLKAVVALPPVYNSTMINTAMLVIEAGNKDVLFVDGSMLVTRERRNDAFITDENKAQLHDILENRKVVEGISFTVPNAEVMEVGDWSITRYSDAEEKIELRPISEINEDLDRCYKRLEELSVQSKNIKLFA